MEHKHEMEEVSGRCSRCGVCSKRCRTCRLEECALPSPTVVSVCCEKCSAKSEYFGATVCIDSSCSCHQKVEQMGGAGAIVEPISDWEESFDNCFIDDNGIPMLIGTPDELKRLIRTQISLAEKHGEEREQERIGKEVFEVMMNNVRTQGVSKIFGEIKVAIQVRNNTKD